MSETSPVNQGDIQQTLFDGLNEHGFLFEEKCAKVLEDNGILTNWSLQSREFPVSANNRDTRIDIILKDSSNAEHQIYAVVECKRVSPRFGHWLFGNPITVNYYEPHFINLYSEHDHRGNYITRYSQRKCPYDHMITYLIDNWWLEQSTSEKRKFASPQPIEDTFIQVLLGVSGLASEIDFQWNKKFLKESSIFIPVVITSAPLYVATYDLENVDLNSGTIESDKVFFGSEGKAPQTVQWLLINYSASRSISPIRLYEDIRGDTLSELESYYKRSLFVVNSEYIIDFFSQLHWGTAEQTEQTTSP